MLQPTEKTISLASTYWTQSTEDFKISEKFYKKKEYYQTTMLATQSAINALTSICIAKGMIQQPSFSVVELIKSCSQYETAFNDLAETAAKMDQVQAFSPYEKSNRVGTPVDNKMAKPFTGWAQEIRQFCKTFISREKLFKV